MLQIKKAIAVCGIITLGSILFSFTGCNNKAAAASSKDIDEALMTNVINDSLTASSDVKTVTVALGDIYESTGAVGRAHFEKTETLTQPYKEGTVTFISSNVNTYRETYVEKGTSLITLMVEFDNFSCEEARISYEKAERSFKKYKEQKEASLEKLEKEIKNAKNKYDKQILEFDYSLELDSYNKYVAEQTALLQELKEKKDFFSQGSFLYDIVAPYDCLVSVGNKYNKGDVIKYGAELATVMDVGSIVFSGTSKDFNFGQKVEVVIMVGTDRITFLGEVVSAPNILVSASTPVFTRIKLTSELPDFNSISYNSLMQVTFMNDVTRIKNGIIIPTSALHSSSGRTGVTYIYEDGVTIKNNVTIGYKGKENTWILDGLTTGQKITVK